MKRIAVALLLTALICNLSLTSVASTSIPTELWDLTLTAYMEQIGIFSDPVNHRGYYSYSAYVNNNKRYSDYYFKGESDNSFDLYGYEVYSVNQQYTVGMKGMYTGCIKEYDVDPGDTYFSHGYTNCGCDLGQYAYFYIDGTYYGVSVSINGTLETYY